MGIFCLLFLHGTIIVYKHKSVLVVWIRVSLCALVFGTEVTLRLSVEVLELKAEASYLGIIVR